MNTLHRIARVSCACMCVLLATGCPSDDPTNPDRGVKSLRISPATPTVIVGAQVILAVKGIDDASRDFDLPSDWIVTWTSSDPKIATLSNGDRIGVHVHGVKEGTVTITVEAEGIVSSVQVQVTNPLGFADGVVFSSMRDGNAEIYMLQQEPVNLTHHAAQDITPTKHGGRIYFSSNRAGNYEIYSMKFDGTDVVRLTNNTVDDVAPSVSATGLIAFSRNVGSGREQIFTMSLLGLNQTNISNNNFHEGNPVWNPSGTRLAYASDRDAKFGPRQYLEIYTMNASGSDVTRLTHNDAGVDYYPSWSPDGTQIAFTSNRVENPTDFQNPTCYNQALEVWVMQANGSGLRNLTNHCRGDASPSWSPDGSEIVFLSDRGTTTNFAWDLWKIPSDGEGTASRLTSTGKESSPAWR